MELINKETGEYDITDEIQCAMSGQDPDAMATALAAQLALQGWDEQALSGRASQALEGEWWKTPRSLVVRQRWPYK